MSFGTLKNRLRHMNRMLLEWVEEGSTAWTGLLVLLAYLLVPHLANIGALEPRYRWQGMLIQLTGIFCVVVGVGKVRKEFALPSIPAEALNYFLRMAKIFKKPQGVNISVSASLGSALGVGAAVILATPGGSVEERIGRLQEELRVVRSDLHRVNDEMNTEFAKLKRDALAEQEARKMGDRSGADFLTKTVTGDMQLQLVGLLYLTVGVVLSSIPQELAAWIG